jgi:anti-sigma regulatory factor (Ser/Thr protein kinase)
VFDHQALLYGSDEDFLATAVPFLDEAAARGEATVVTVEPPLGRALLDAVRDPESVEMVGDRYESPLAALRAYHELFSRALEPLRVIGQIPHAGLRDDWLGWARYEAVANDFFAPFPVEALCPYDTRTTPDAVLEDVVLTHPGVAGVGGHRHNPDYIEPEAFLALLAEGEVDVLERTQPRFVIHDPHPVDARQAVVALARLAKLGPAAGEQLGLATSEVVANAIAYGEPPVRLSAWSRGGRVAVAVSDHGVGPEDPYAGLMPGHAGGPSQGLGLHIAYQVCNVALTYSATAFTVHLASRSPLA